VRDHIRSQLTDPSQVSRPHWLRWAKYAVARVGLLRAVVSEYVILAERGFADVPSWKVRLWEHLRDSVPHCPKIDPAFMLSTDSFEKKNLVKVFDSHRKEVRLILKTSTVAPGSQEVIASEFENLSLVTAHLRRERNPYFSAPEPLGCFRAGSFFYAVE